MAPSAGGVEAVEDEVIILRVYDIASCCVGKELGGSSHTRRGIEEEEMGSDEAEKPCLLGKRILRLVAQKCQGSCESGSWLSDWTIQFPKKELGGKIALEDVQGARVNVLNPQKWLSCRFLGIQLMLTRISRVSPLTQIGPNLALLFL
ncbi:hypothetical protein KIL84_007406 [Mauremys mutica]|uniref:Uncharacterized protein n=1 Tax=Mauremys mutica TaxID=74926 RepID=A0A9D3X2M6_9SAUR|nr:hypothetical protein KIL84_007406 [Mauremys mutica]